MAEKCFSSKFWQGMGGGVTDDLCMNACLCVNAAVLVYALECFAVTGMFSHVFDAFNAKFPLVVCELSELLF